MVPNMGAVPAFVVMVRMLVGVRGRMLVGVGGRMLVGVRVKMLGGVRVTKLVGVRVKLFVGLQPPVAMKLPVNGRQAPGASEIRASTGLLVELLNTKMFVTVMLPPVLQTCPPNTTRLPLVTGPGGQSSVMVMPGVVMIGHSLLTVLVTTKPQILKPLAVKVSATKKQLVGAR